MPDLTQSLQSHDLGHLQIIARFWEVSLDAPDARRGLQLLVDEMLKPSRAAGVMEKLPTNARQALDELLVNNGRLTWALFTRKYGEVRAMGPARRDREQPFLHPAGAAEELWYRGLVGRAFFDTAKGAQEFAYIPEDLLLVLPAGSQPVKPALGRRASPAERETILLASDRILDHACTLLAALRLGLPDRQVEALSAAWEKPGVSVPLSPAPLKTLLASAGLVDESGMPLPEPARLFLEAARGDALVRLVRAWRQSDFFNELRLLPGLVAEGEWSNDPLETRTRTLDLLAGIPPGVWWSLTSFVDAVKQAFPDFQRPAGDYDSFYLRQADSDVFLRGFEHWEAVDGAVIRYILCGPLHWLGIVDLAAPKPQATPQKPAFTYATAFRFSRWAHALLAGTAPAGLPAEEEKIKVRSNARLAVPRLAPRVVRYQIARFADWDAQKDDIYPYRITPASLERARQQGLRAGQLVGLVRRHSAGMPPSLARALERWEEHGIEAKIEQVTILRLRSPEMLQMLRGSRAARFLGDPLGPTVVVVKEGAWEKVLEVLAELGYLGDAGELGRE